MTIQPHIAQTFIDSYRDQLNSMGFSLPPYFELQFDNWLSTAVVFKNKIGFELAFSFIPHDGKIACVRCGRRFQHSAGANLISGMYYKLAERFGYDFPKLYSLDGPEESVRTLVSIMDDITSSLPDILSRIGIEDIEALELTEGGALRHIQFVFRRLDNAEISVSPIDFE